MNKFKKYEEKINSIKYQLLQFIEKYKEAKIVGYGASATSTTLISHFELGKYFSYLVDDNLDKINMFSPGFHVPVYSIDKIEKSNPDVIIVLAWRFRDEILKKLSFFKGTVIIPLPNLEVINHL